MEFVFGAALIVLAIGLLGAARFFVTRHENSSWVTRFAGTETMALVITMVSAFGSPSCAPASPRTRAPWA